MILKKAPLPADIIALGVDGINQIWREAKLRGSGLEEGKDSDIGCRTQHWKP